MVHRFVFGIDRGTLLGVCKVLTDGAIDPSASVSALKSRFSG
jgi:hypothetical protein